MTKTYYCKCGKKASFICECGTVFCDKHFCDEDELELPTMPLDIGLKEGIIPIVGKLDKRTLKVVRDKIDNIAMTDSRPTLNAKRRLIQWLDKNIERE